MKFNWVINHIWDNEDNSPTSWKLEDENGDIQYYVDYIINIGYIIKNNKFKELEVFDDFERVKEYVEML